MKFSLEQLNFFKFSTVVIDEFPDVLRKAFVFMWDTRVATTPGVPKWDDSVTVLNMFLTKEGGVKKVPTLNKSFKEWDCTALFKATLFAQTFAMPDGTGGVSTLDKLYVRPRGLSTGTFHHSVISPTGNTAETYALALDQLRLLRNTLCHQSSTQKIDRVTFDHYIVLSKDAFTALGQDTTRIDDIGKLGEEDFPTARLQQVEDELKREKYAAIKFKQIDDHLVNIDSQVEDVGSDVKDVKSDVTGVKTQVEEVGSDVKDVKSDVTDVKTQVEDVGSDVKDVKSDVTDMKTQVEDVGSDVKDVKSDVTDVKTQVEDVGSDVKDVGSDVKDVKSDVTDVKTQVEDVGSDVKDVKSDVTDVKTQVEDVGSDVKDVKSDVTDVKTQMKDFGSVVKELKEDIKRAMQEENLKVPISCIPEKIPHFVGRQEECLAVLNHLTRGDTRLVDVWGPPGFGKTSVAVKVAHHLKEMKIPVYFTSLRGMKSKEDLVSKLLSIFTDAKQAFYVSPSHWLIQSLQQLKNSFVLILDNADDLLESGDSKVKEDVLGFTKEILDQCSQIKLLLTTRESLDYLSHRLSIHQERVGLLDGVSSVSLVKSQLPDVSADDCRSIAMVCGQVPLAMRLMCSIMMEENVSLTELFEELEISPLVEVLDNESFSDDARLKTIINKSFERLTSHERDAFVSLAVFPSSFGVEEATAVLDLKTARLTKKVIGSLKRKSLIDCSEDVESFTIHSLLRSFIDERRMANQTIQTTFHAAQLRFYDYQITSFGEANEKFLTGYSSDALQVFIGQRESILLSLVNGAKDDALYPKVAEVLSRAELFFYSVLSDEKELFDRVYCTAVQEAKKRQRRHDECNLLAAKSFGSLSWLNVNRPSWDESLIAGIRDSTDSCLAKRLCYFGIHQLQCGKLDCGISSLRTSVDRLNGINCDEKVLKVLTCHALAVCYRKKGDKENASKFETFCGNECKSTSLSPVVRSVFLQDSSSADEPTDLASIVEQDVFFFLVMAKTLTALYTALEFGKEAKTELSLMTRHFVGLYKVFLPLSGKGMLHVSILQACSFVLYSLSCFKEAAEGFQIITDKLENTPGNWPGKSTALAYLFRGLALKELKDHEVAFYCLKKALNIRRRLLQENKDATHGNKMIGETIDSLKHCLEMQENLNGGTFGHTNDFKVICEEIRSDLKAMEKICGVNLAKIATNYNQLGCCYSLLDDTSGALESYHQALKILEEHVVDSEDKATCLLNIGAVYLKMNRNSEAGKAFQSALNRRKSLEIEDHADTAFIYHSLGKNHLAQGELSEALNAHRQGLQLTKKHLGDHPLTAQSFKHTGNVYLMMGEYQAARNDVQNAADILTTLLGDHKDTASAFQLLSTVNLEMGNHKEALDACRQARNIRSKVLGEHVKTAASLHNFGVICFKMRNFKRAVRSFRRASAVSSKLLGDHLNTALSYHCLGEAQMSMGEFSGAMESLRKALSIREKEKHSDAAVTLELLEQAYIGQLVKSELASQK
ncbi:uncharacterized protein LOC144651641 isoform X2 [Oculina patagonica]